MLTLLADDGLEIMRDIASGLASFKTLPAIHWKTDRQCRMRYYAAKAAALTTLCNKNCTFIFGLIHEIIGYQTYSELASNLYVEVVQPLIHTYLKLAQFIVRTKVRLHQLIRSLLLRLANSRSGFNDTPGFHSNITLLAHRLRSSKLGDQE